MHVPGLVAGKATVQYSRYVWSGLLGSRVALGFWFMKHQFSHFKCGYSTDGDGYVGYFRFLM